MTAYKTDVVIAGCGVGGLYTALKLPRDLDITIITKGAVDDCDSNLAQGGICVEHDDNDYQSFFEDTMKAGHYENDPDAVDQMINSSRSVIRDLIHYGTRFARKKNGQLDYTKEGAHSRNRILFHEDITGKEITSHLLAAVRKRKNIHIYDHVTMVDLLTSKRTPVNPFDTCRGFLCLARADSPLAQYACEQADLTGFYKNIKQMPAAAGAGDTADGGFSANNIVQKTAAQDISDEETPYSHKSWTDPDKSADEYISGSDYLAETDWIPGDRFVCIEAENTILATGGIGGLYEHSTNYPHLTGDGLAVCLMHDIALENPDYVQIHPTSFYSKKAGRAFLISESVRGEGGILLSAKTKKRFVNELLPRDVVSRAIYKQMEKDGTDHVLLSMERIPTDVIKDHFRHIYEHCLGEGYDCTKEPIPIVPAQHYFMGGIKVDLNAETSMPHLYAVGETCCNGVHGKNRLASNSLLESLVWAEKAAVKIESRSPNISDIIDNKDLDNPDKNINSSLNSDGTVRDEQADFSNPVHMSQAGDFIMPDFDLYRDTYKLFAQYRKIVQDEIERMKKYHEEHPPILYSAPVGNGNEVKRRQADQVSA